MSSPPFQEKIHFLDIASSLPGHRQSWSPNTLKTRLLLNAKQIPYTEQYVSYPDIAPLLASYGVPRTEDGYTLPAIYHPESLPAVPGGKILTESVAIAHHLDTLYPAAPVHAFPAPKHQSEALWLEAEAKCNAIVAPSKGKGFRLLMPRIPGILDPRGAEYFIRTRTADHPEKVSPLEWGSPDVEDDWTTVRPAVVEFNEYLVGKRAHAAGEGPFLMGSTPSMGDMYLVGVLVWFRAAGEELLERMLAIGEPGEGEGALWETSPIRGVWDSFERNGWLTAQGEERVITAEA